MAARVFCCSGVILGVVAAVASKGAEAEPAGLMKSELSYHQIASNEVHETIEYSLVLPKTYAPKGTRLPLLVLLHGGGGSARSMVPMTNVLIRMIDHDEITPMVVVTPSCDRCLYVNRRDGKANWESFILDELIVSIRKEFNVMKDRKGLVIMGPSMGGLGTLRMALKHPDLFLAAAASSPGIEAGITFKDVPPEKYLPSRPLRFMEDIFGKLVDGDGYWTKNNPAAIARENADKIKASGIKLWLEVGTADDMGCYPGSVFLHQVLREAKIEHAYAEVKDGKHDAAFFGPSLRRGVKFLSEQLRK
jgi:S-formylglutathione hydrolase